MAENDFLQQLRERLAELERHILVSARESASVAAGAESVSPQIDIGTAIQLALNELRTFVPFDSASVQELRGDRLVIIGGIGFADLDVILGETFEVESIETPNGEVVHRRRPYIVADTELYRGFRRGLHVGQGIRSWLGAPLLYRDQILGILTLDKAERGAYDQDDQRVAMAFASVIAKAIAGEPGN